MAGIHMYLISLCAAAIVCGIIIKLSPEKWSGAVLIKLLCGVFMLITLLSPVISLPVYEFQAYFDQLSTDAASIAAQGKEYAQKETDSIMQQHVNAYIQEKAQSLGMDLNVNVTVKDGILCSISIFGAASPYKRLQLSEYIRDHLGIALEDQQWNIY